MTRTLSALESKLILRLEWDKKPTVTIQEAQSILGISYNHARLVLHRLAQDKWLARIVAGSYELIPAERGEYAFPDTNPLFLGSTLASPYYFSYATAAFFHGLSTQASAIVYVATTQGKSQQRLVRDKAYRLVVQPEHKFFGETEVDAYGSQVKMADPEKTILDSLDHPKYAGGIPEVVAMLAQAKGRLNWEKMAEYATRFESRALVQRLGYLADLLELPMPSAARKVLTAQVDQGIAYLGQPRQWHTGGDYNAAWQIVDNIPRHELLAETKVQ
jgi:predicted transcriptional regulator of viral defense system